MVKMGLKIDKDNDAHLKKRTELVPYAQNVKIAAANIGTPSPSPSPSPALSGEDDLSPIKHCTLPWR